MANPDPTIQSDFAVVALLDALGTKGLLSRSAPDGLLETWQTLLAVLEGLCNEVKASKATEACTFLAFSDTILITVIPISETDQPECLTLMHDLLQRFIWHAFVNGVYFRGAFSTGRFIQSAFRVIEESLEEAAEWYEQANGMGVMATPSANHLIEQMALVGWSMQKSFIKHDVPLRSNKRYDTWAVNWPKYADDETETENSSGKSKLLRSFRAYSGAISPSVADKYANTLAFAHKVWQAPSSDSQS